MKSPIPLQRIKNFLISFIHIQLFIVLISLPILVSWGMPISLLTIAGNFLFSPILTIFLLLSSLIFFFEILHIPNNLLITALEHVTHWWLRLMQHANHSILVSLAMPSIFILILIFLSTLLILHYKKLKNPWVASACYALLLIISCIYLILTPLSTEKVINLNCNKGTVYVLKSCNKIIVIDPGVIGRRLSAASWCEYTLLPALSKELGTNIVDHMVILQPNRIIFEALVYLQEKILIKNIYIPLWHGDMPSFWLRSFMSLKQHCAKNNCNFIRLGNRPITILNDITISPLDEKITVNEFWYPPFHVEAAIDKKSISFYSAKRKLLQKKDLDGTSQNSDNNRS